MFDIVLESIRSGIVAVILFILILEGRKSPLQKKPGWQLIVTGFFFLLFASLIDITDNFPSLNQYILIGDTEVEAILEKIFGYLLGLILIAIGFRKWLSKVTEAENLKIQLEKTVEHVQQSHQELLNSSKLESIGVLAGGIAHDFNNILMGILGNIELARTLISSQNKEADDLLEQAEKASLRARKLTEQLLSFATGGDPVKKVSSLKELITESTVFALSGTNVKHFLDIQKNIWPVDIDPSQISQVIQNIIINARQAMPNGGEIMIRCRNIPEGQSDIKILPDKRKYVGISIKDTGNGISEDNLRKIFDPFFSTKEDGSGLGLAVCHAIISKHGGFIDVKSPTGSGTEFHIYLPAAKQQTVSEDTPYIKVTDKVNARIMIMDDDEIVRQVAQIMLENMGCEIVIALNGDEAVSRYSDLMKTGKKVDLVIMDLNIPGGLGGKEAVKQLLSIDPEAKVVVSSGYTNDPVMTQYQKYGFQAFLSKPYKSRELRKIITKILD